MKKFLLTLFAAFVAFGAFAEEYPVVTSVEELKQQPEGTMVLFENIDVVVVEEDMGYYVSTSYTLSDGTALEGELPWPMPMSFSAVGSLSSDENGVYTFNVTETKSVSKFATLADLFQYASPEAQNTEIVKNSANIVAEGGTAVVTSVYEDYVFCYSIKNTGYYNQTYYGVMVYPDAAENVVIGDELSAKGGFKGVFTPSEAVYDNDDNLVSYKGGHYTLDNSVYLSAINWYEAVNITYTPCDFVNFAQNYVGEAQPVRVPKGGTFAEKDGKYYYESSVTEEYYDYDTYEWKDTTYTVSIEVASVYVDFADRVGMVSEDYVAGVYDYCNTGDTPRLLVNKFVSSVSECGNIKGYLSLGNQQEEEILTTFVNPLLVTYTYFDEYKIIIMVQDETGALALDYSEAAGTDDEAALKAIKPGDTLSGVKGYAYFNTESQSPRLVGATMDWATYETITYIPVVEESGAAVKPVMTVTVGDMIKEWSDCQENASMPAIANNVVRLFDVRVVDTLNKWSEPVKYLIQGTDTMELSKLWGENKMNFQTFERNNMVGIADYCCINTNYIYQFQPLSQEHITDASLTPEVASYDELVANEGVPVIYRGAVVDAVVDGWYTSFTMCDGQVFVNQEKFPVTGKFDLMGIYNEGVFDVIKAVNVYGFNTPSDMDNYVALVDPEAAGVAYNIIKPLPVSHVEGNNVFVYFDGFDSYGYSSSFATVLQGVKADVKMGDVIEGVKGVSHATDSYRDENWNTHLVRGAYFEVADDANITVVSSDNEVAYGSAMSAMYFIYNGYQYNAKPLKLAVGATIVERDGKYYAQEEAPEYDEDWNEVGTITYEVELVSNTVDFAAYVGKPTEDVMCGVLDYMNTTPEACVFYVHAAESIYRNYETIADLVAAGGNSSDYISVLNNKVVVSYIHDDGWSKSMFVQDETAGLYVYFADPANTLEGINVGDAIEGLKGSASWDSSWGRPASMLASDPDYYDYALNVVSSGNAVEPVNATLAELVAEGRSAKVDQITPVKYANRLVQVKEVSYEMGKDEYGEEWPCLVQGTDTLLVVKNFAETWGVEAGKTYDIVGIVDGGYINYSNLYTIQPRSVEDIDNAGVVGVEAANNGIYLNAANQVVAEGAVAVVVYDLNGRTVAAANAAVVDAETLAQGVYVVRATYADGEVKTAKVVR